MGPIPPFGLTQTTPVSDDVQVTSLVTSSFDMSL